MLSALARKISLLLIAASHMEPDEDQMEVYVYGWECILNTGITVFILLIWGLITHALFETCIWIAAFSALRKHSGGFHAPTQLSCITTSCLLGMSDRIIIEFVPYRTITAFFALIFCMGVCILFAPTDTSKYELTEAIKKKEKLLSLLIIAIGFLIAILLKNSIGISILYAHVCTCVLLLIKIAGGKLKA